MLQILTLAKAPLVDSGRILKRSRGYLKVYITLIKFKKRNILVGMQFLSRSFDRIQEHGDD